MESEITYEIQWFIPAENAIGGKAYWIRAGVPEFSCFDEALKLFSEGKKRYEKGTLRLVKIERTVLEEN